MAVWTYYLLNYYGNFNFASAPFLPVMPSKQASGEIFNTIFFVLFTGSKYV